VFTGLIGAAIFAFRGDPPWGRRRRSVGLFGLGTLAWGIFFAGTGAALIIGQPYGVSVNEAGEVVGRPDSQLGSTIAGSGGPATPSGWGWKSAGEAGGSFDKIRKIERLQKPREGAITDGEFQREKSKILAEPG
jgi:hypothetical protein